MIFTLGVNAVLRGLMVMLTGGFAPQSSATPIMKLFGGGATFGIGNSLVVWVVISAGIVFMLTRTPMGRYIYATGNREAATYLSGINTKLVLIFGFVACSMCAALSGLLVAGYTSKAFQAMGDVYLLPSIAAVVVGGTNILGGQGHYTGTVVGTILIVLLQSVLSVMQMPEAGRQIIYGAGHHRHAAGLRARERGAHVGWNAPGHSTLQTVECPSAFHPTNVLPTFRHRPCRPRRADTCRFRRIGGTTNTASRLPTRPGRASPD